MLGLVGPKLLKGAAILVAISLFIYALWLPIVHVFPKYAPPTTIDRLPSSAQVANEALSPGVNIVGYEVIADQPLIPGTGLEIILYWQAAKENNFISDPVLRLALNTANGEVLSSHESWPTPSLPPENWPQGKIVETRSSLFVPDIGITRNYPNKGRCKRRTAVGCCFDCRITNSGRRHAT